MATVTVSMPEDLKLFVDEEVEMKGFGDAGEYIRSLLTKAQSGADARLETLLLEGLEGGPDIEINGEFYRQLRSEMSQMIAEHVEPVPSTK